MRWDKVLKWLQANPNRHQPGKRVFIREAGDGYFVLGEDWEHDILLVHRMLDNESEGTHDLA